MKLCVPERPTPALLSAVLLLLAVTLPAVATAQPSGEALWSDIDDRFLKSTEQRDIVPLRYRTVSLDMTALEELLAQAPREGGADATLGLADSGVVLELPLPNGGFGRFQIVESPIMAPGLAAKFPEIKTYRGQGLDDPTATVRFDRTPAGFHATILSAHGDVYIDPYSRRQTETYVVYNTRDAARPESNFECLVDDQPKAHEPAPAHRRPTPTRSAPGIPVTLRTYRLAVAATGEYTTFHGGTVAQGQAAIVTAMNRVNGIYEREVAIRMVLIANNDLLVYTNGNTDPYNNGSGVAMLGQNQANIDSVIGTANYDIGHVFSTGGGGVATLFGPCNASTKARGVTGLGAPTGDPFWVDFVAHEMGHQWSGNHTFNGNDGNCAGGNRNPGTAYEPGSGTTIQAYAGICGTQNIQPNSDDYFHGVSLDEIIGFSTAGGGDSCDVPSATGNDLPEAEAGMAYTIPISTPFELCGSGSDINGDSLTYGWEEFDLGPTGAPNSPSGDAAIFRSFSPTTSPCRTFPQLSDLLNNTQTLGEILPSYARTMTFRLTVRDNVSGGGGTANDSTTVTVEGGAGPFVVTSPNAAVALASGSMTTVTWDVASTDQAPVSCATVDIDLSTDGGMTFATSLAAGTANDGTEMVTLPGSASAQARIRVRCSTSIFFDISDVDFSIGVPAVEITAPTDGLLVTRGDSVMFTGTASDPEDGDISANLEWTSDLQGPIGNGASFSTDKLGLGTHTITASVTDSDTNTETASIMVSVEPQCIVEEYSGGFETTADGWATGTQNCTTGTFIRGTPDEVIDGVVTQPSGAATGTFAWFTQNNGGGVGTDDVDGGTCETLSSAIAIPAGEPVTVFLDYFHGQRTAGDDAADGMTIELLDAGTDAVLATLVDIGDVTNVAEWTPIWSQTAGAPATVRLRVRATDGAGAGDLIEGGIDNVRVCSGESPFLFDDGFETGNTSRWTTSTEP